MWRPFSLAAVAGRPKPELRLAGARVYRIEYRREIAGRGVDDLQDLVGRSLLLQKLVAVDQACLQPFARGHGDGLLNPVN